MEIIYGICMPPGAATMDYAGTEWFTLKNMGQVVTPARSLAGLRVRRPSILHIDLSRLGLFCVWMKYKLFCCCGELNPLFLLFLRSPTVTPMCTSTPPRTSSTSSLPPHTSAARTICLSALAAWGRPRAAPCWPSRRGFGRTQASPLQTETAGTDKEEEKSPSLGTTLYLYIDIH